MKQSVIKRANPPLILSYVISFILIIAAIAKLSSPVAAFPDVDYAAAIFEIVLSLALITFFSRWEMWALTAIVFASWGGFAFFWVLWGVPCSCLGSWIILHPGISFATDAAFIAASGLMIRRLGASYKQLSKVFWFCLPIALLGFIIAHSLYTVYF